MLAGSALYVNFVLEPSAGARQDACPTCLEDHAAVMAGTWKACPLSEHSSAVPPPAALECAPSSNFSVSFESHGAAATSFNGPLVNAFPLAADERALATNLAPSFQGTPVKHAHPLGVLGILMCGI